MRHPKRSPRWAERRADDERAAGIPDLPILEDCRDVLPLDLRKHGGGELQIEPRLGYASCRLRNVATGEVVMVGTLKQVFRYLSRQIPHTAGARNYEH
jgi:hypothetical protein